MAIETGFGFEQFYCLYFLPIAWLIVFLFKSFNPVWPQLLPSLKVRYPQLNNIIIESDSAPHVSGFNIQKLLLLMAISLFIIALAQPVRYTGVIQGKQQYQPVDLIFAVDTALSMSLSDYLLNNKPVSRLTMAKMLMGSFIQQYSGKHLALLVIGNPPSLWLPLTTDKQVVQNAVSRLTPFLGGRITDMGATLNLIGEKFTQTDNSDNSGNVQDAQDKVVVLISDGGTQVGSMSPQNAAKKLADKGFSLYVIAVGSDDPEAGSYDNSNLIYEPANLFMLQQVAEQGRGQLFHAVDSQGFTAALQLIEQQHKKPLAVTETIKLSQPLYPWPLLSGLIILLITVFFSGSRSGHVS